MSEVNIVKFIEDADGVLIQLSEIGEIVFNNEFDDGMIVYFKRGKRDVIRTLYRGNDSSGARLRILNFINDHSSTVLRSSDIYGYSNDE